MLLAAKLSWKKIKKVLGKAKAPKRSGPSTSPGWRSYAPACAAAR